LERVEREVLPPLAGNHLVGGPHDRPGPAFVERAARRIGECRGLLDLGERRDQPWMDPLRADLEGVERACGLDPVEGAQRHIALSDGITLDTLRLHD
jgi:hypothetical protein